MKDATRGTQKCLHEVSMFAPRLISVFDHVLQVHIGIIGFDVVFRGVSSPESVGCRSNVHVQASLVFTPRVTGFGKKTMDLACCFQLIEVPGNLVSMSFGFGCRCLSLSLGYFMGILRGLIFFGCKT